MKSSLILICLALTCLSGAAAPYAVGSKIAPFKCSDQHERAFIFKPASTRFLLVNHDMKIGKLANAALDKLGAKFLPKHHAVFLSNIHGMPSIGRMFAMPKMRKYAHRIILADDEKLIAKFSESAGQVTVLKLDNGKVVSISYWDPSKQAVTNVLK